MREEEIVKLLNTLCDDYKLLKIKTENDKFEVLVQCKLLCYETFDMKCDEWIKQFSQLTNTNWITKRRFPKAVRYDFRKIFLCQHSSLNKSDRLNKNNTSRNLICHANIDFKFKKINRNTVKNDPLLKIGLSVVIKIDYRHSHRLNVAQAFRLLRCSDHTKQQFLSYFKSGMTPASAKTYHEMHLTESSPIAHIAATLANSQINPTNRQIYHLYESWRRSQYGDRDEISVIEVLKQKKQELLHLGVQIYITEKPMIVVIITPIMKRAFLEGYAEEIIFIDSSGSCDEASTCVTFMFVVTKAGAVPLATVLHNAQTESNYTMGFLAVKNALENECNKILNPKVIMTDDSAAERRSLGTVFPDARLLLCVFHVCQAMWRWIWKNEHKIQNEHRKHIMNSFRRVLYAPSQEEAEDLMNELLLDDRISCNSQLIQHFKKFWERRSEWCLSHRHDVITRGNDTNNYCEASIRIFKDVVLQRCKVFNACALVDFIAKTFEEYHKRRLLDFSNSRRRTLQITYLKFCQKSRNISKIYQLSENVFQVESESEDATLYTIYADISCCDCPSGRGGSFCKHLCAIEQNFHITCSSSPRLLKTDRIKLAALALGDNSTPDNFFDDLLEVEEENSISETSEVHIIAEKTTFLNDDIADKTNRENSVEVIHINENNTFYENAVETVKSEFLRIFDILKENPDHSSTAIIMRFASTLKNIQTPTQALSFIVQKATSKISKNIKVQPTSISRRKNRGLPKGHKRIQAGRPSNSENKLDKEKKAKKKKRMHNLGQNIEDNKPSAKIH